MKTYEFTKCWVGSYVGGGEYVGERCPDVLINNVPSEIEKSKALYQKRNINYQVLVILVKLITLLQ